MKSTSKNTFMQKYLMTHRDTSSQKSRFTASKRRFLFFVSLGFEPFLTYKSIFRGGLKKTRWLLLFNLMLVMSIDAQQQREPAFSLDLWTEGGLGSAILTIGLTSVDRMKHMEPFSGSRVEQKAELLPWDRPFAGTYDHRADQLSDWLLWTGLTPWVISLGALNQQSLKREDVWVQTLMLAEALSLQAGMNAWIRSFRFWPRPYVLGDQGPENPPAEASGSFYSGHASGAFTVAVFTGYWFDQTFPNSTWSVGVWGGGISVATWIAVLRVKAGKHYPTDVVTGALVGSLIGWWVPWMHRNQDRTKTSWVLIPYPGGLQYTRFF